MKTEELSVILDTCINNQIIIKGLEENKQKLAEDTGMKNHLADKKKNEFEI